jgi:hypothetical protein
MRAMDCKFNRFKEKNYFHYKKRRERENKGGGHQGTNSVKGVI